MIVSFALVLVSCAAGVLITTLLYRKELRRMTRFLMFRHAGSNARLARSATSREFTDLAQAINRQLDAIQDSQIGRMHERSEFQHQLTNFSHDVRTPLMGAKGYLQLSLDETDPNTRERYLQAAEARIDDVNDLLDQLHIYTQSVDADAEYDIRNVQIMPVIANVLYGFYPLFEAHHWEPRVEFENEGFFAPCDEIAIKRIFDNLVSNVLKYGTSPLVVTQRTDRSGSPTTSRHLSPST